MQIQSGQTVPLKPWIWIGIQPKMLDPDPDEMNADQQPCFFHFFSYNFPQPHYLQIKKIKFFAKILC
jgi:hypothetical protein